MGLTDRIMSWLGYSKISERDSFTEAPGSSGQIRDPKEIGVKRIGLQFDGESREASPPDFDLAEIQKAYDTEAYVRQAIDKYIEFMFKAGWDFVGDNPAVVEYLEQRFGLMAEMTGTPVRQLFIEIAEDLVKFSNVVVIKARDKDNVISSVLPTQVQGLQDMEPVAGYFPVNMTTMKVLRDKNGMVKRWEQEVDGGGKPAKYKAVDAIHIFYKREKGKAFGTPMVLPVLDDIRALRQAEENVLKLMYRNIFPFIHAKVGTTELPGTREEVDDVQAQIESGDLEAGLVTTERVEMTSVAADKVIDAEKYLRYFEQRVFSGLGVPELLFGRGNTANRSTGDNLSGEFTERVKAYQRVMEIFVNDFMIRELLMEAGFDPLLNPQDKVEFRFREIDFDAKIKKENHAIFKYEQNAITEDEMRNEIGMDPITDRGMMYMNLVTIETANATAAAKAAASPSGSGGGASKSATNKNKPANQHGTKSSPKKTTNSVEDIEEPKAEIHLIELQISDLQDNLLNMKPVEVAGRVQRIGILASSYAKNMESIEQIRDCTERISTELAESPSFEVDDVCQELANYQHQISSIITIDKERGEAD